MANLFVIRCEGQGSKVSAIDSTHIYGVVNLHVTMDNFKFWPLLSPLRLLFSSILITKLSGIFFAIFFLKNYKSFEII